MAQAKEGDRVKVHYSQFLEDETVVDSSHGKEPLEFTLGQGAVIPGIESAIVGMNEGDKRDVAIPAEDAFGPRNEDLIIDVDKARIPADINLEVGKILQIRSDDGNTYNMTVMDISEEVVKLDGNHPLAGKELNFTVELVEIL